MMSKKFLFFLLSLFGLLWFWSISAIAKEQQIACSIREVEGEVVVQKAVGGDWEPGVQGDLLRSGDTIQTRGASRVGLLFTDGSIIRLRENSMIKVKSLTQDNETGEMKTSLNVLFGTMWAKVRRIFSEESSFEVETPTSVAAVKGTIFIVSHENRSSHYILVDREGGSGISVRVLGEEAAVNLQQNGEQVVVTPEGVGNIEQMNQQELEKLLDWGEGMINPDQGEIDPIQTDELFLTLFSPVDSFLTDQSDVVVLGATLPEVAVRINDQTILADRDGEFTAILNLTDGSHVVTVIVEDSLGNQFLEEPVIFVNTGAPVISIADDLTRAPFTSNTNYNMSIFISDPTPSDQFKIKIDENEEAGEWFEIRGNMYTYFPNLSEGSNQIEIFVRDQVGHEAYLAIDRWRDTLPPIITFINPPGSIDIARVPPSPPGHEPPPFKIRGQAIDPGECANPSVTNINCPIEVQVNGVDAAVDENGTFEVELPRVVGEVLAVRVIAYDFLENRSEKAITIRIGQ